MIVVFGSLNADLVFRTPVLPGPGETVLTPEYAVIPGGKGANQAFAAARAGARTRMVGCVGGDDFGNVLLASLAGAGVDTTAILRITGRTGCAAIAVDAKGENQIVVAGGANLTARAAQVPDEWLGARTILMLQMEVLPEENWALAARAREAGGRILLNAAPAAPVPATAFELIDTLVVNESEATIVADAAGIREADPVMAARNIARRYGLDCVVTLGAAGAVAFSDDGAVMVPPLKVTPVDTTGAGDTFCGVLAASLDAGMEFADALRRAGVGGALACTRPGAQTGMPTGAEIDANIAQAPSVRPWTPHRQKR